MHDRFGCGRGVPRCPGRFGGYRQLPCTGAQKLRSESGDWLKRMFSGMNGWKVWSVLLCCAGRTVTHTWFRHSRPNADESAVLPSVLTLPFVRRPLAARVSRETLL